MAKQLKTRQIPEYQEITDIFGGKPLKDRPDVLLALEQCGLNWETLVSEVCISDKMRTKIPGYRCTYRRDPVTKQNIPFGIVRGRYTPRHNADSFLWVDNVLGAHPEAHIISGGLLFGGAKVWIAVKLSEVTIGADTAEILMVVLNTNDGSSNWSVHFVPMWKKGKCAVNFHDPGGFYKIRHTKSSDIRMAEIQDIFKLGSRSLQEFAELAGQMATTELDAEESDNLIYRCLDVKPKEAHAWFNAAGKTMKQPQWVNQYYTIRALLRAGEERPTVWSVLLAVATFYDHLRTVRGSEKNSDLAFESRMYGYSAKQKYIAYGACLAFLRDLAKRAKSA